ncbi:hypothetical protein SAMN05660462_01883 [Proteiniborus ethanoligenes]|uniref:Permease n=1 Tax=Proteiniborus ethanoligenes TaxID=415015 RepID=A0A1H3QBW3_9FIRM|nr:permease [Proteiniborus ethanoligenes]TAH63312.1 MAG: permease [Gottschalkiaceae bacterium]SDZ10763.1 hypothetical protein SAMN05660462_01883 [Proteiniborus ethanoligenes]
MFTKALYVLAIFLTVFSFVKDKKKTKIALKKAWKSFESILPQFLAILILIGIMLAVLSPETISKLLGSGSGIIGMLGAGLIGSITLIPAFVAFPLTAALYNNGAGITQVAVFVSTLMMVGVATMPLEMKYFGKAGTITRNLLAFILSFVVAGIMGAILA